MKICLAMIRSAGAFALFASGFTPAMAATEKIIYNFPANAFPYGQLSQDGKGTLYGTAVGLDGHGAIYRLKEKNGAWKYETLFDFNGGNGDSPYAGPLIDRSTGILYGVTLGNVYSLARAGPGWSETVLHTFTGSDGAEPYAMLLKDKATGNLYGTTYQGGAYYCGTAFQLAAVKGTWTFSTIHSFTGSDVCYPWTQLQPGAKKGTFVGAAQYVSPRHTPDGLYGEVFELKQTGGVWGEQVLHTFTGSSDGAYPYDLAASSDGTIYGVTEYGGQNRSGVVFQLTPNRKKYTFSVIYSFNIDTGGAAPVGITLEPATGNLYGTTSDGVGPYKRGTVFRLVKNGDTWTETVLHSFTGGDNDGATPQSRPILDSTTGYLYGTTPYGGTNNGGTVYEIQP
jgi:uncharacterized repeat protein (TIGR03803 family)